MVMALPGMNSTVHKTYANTITTGPMGPSDCTWPSICMNQARTGRNRKPTKSTASNNEIITSLSLFMILVSCETPLMSDCLLGQR